ncbi:hypothetical protein FGB62_1g685 [Gracilaria domingensis]|nr:hypothetical protein FGB62_1g685 [Gracilaria domingensis]
MDLQSYESQAPILDGIPISVKVLLHSGTAQIHDQFTPGLHADIHVDIEDPSINLTARQLKWIDHIVKAGFGLHANNNHSRSASAAVSPTRRRRPPTVGDGKHSSAPTSDGLSEDETDRSEAEGSVSASDDMSISSRLEKELTHQLQTSRSNSSENSAKKLSRPYSEQSQLEDDNVGYDEDYEEDELIIVQDPNASDDSEQPARRGGLSSFWQAIVSENVDDTVDDAAIALGLANGHTQEEEEDVDMIQEAEEGGEPEHQFAREAVNAAAEAGGLTMQLVLRTPDHEAWGKLKKLEEELEEEKKIRTRLEDAERILKESEQRIQDSEAMAQKLRDRNEALVKELQDLENMTSQAGKNKDAMIRQMEAALGKAERNLQAILQAKFEKDANSAITKSIQVNTYDEESDELRPVSNVSEEKLGHQELSSTVSGSVRPEDEDGNMKEQPKSEDAQEAEERTEPLNQKPLDAVHESVEEKEQVPLSTGLRGNERAANSDFVPRQATTETPPAVPNGTGIESSHSASVRVQESGLQEIQLHNDRYGQLSMDAPSVSISKLIADMSTKVDVTDSSRNKHLEAAMSSEGLTLI